MCHNSISDSKLRHSRDSKPSCARAPVGDASSGFMVVTRAIARKMEACAQLL